MDRYCRLFTEIFPASSSIPSFIHAGLGFEFKPNRSDMKIAPLWGATTFKRREDRYNSSKGLERRGLFLSSSYFPDSIFFKGRIQILPWLKLRGWSNRKNKAVGLPNSGHSVHKLNGHRWVAWCYLLILPFKRTKEKEETLESTCLISLGDISRDRTTKQMHPLLLKTKWSCCVIRLGKILSSSPQSML